MLNDYTQVEDDHLENFNLSFLKLTHKVTNINQFCGRCLMDITPASQAGEYDY